MPSSPSMCTTVFVKNERSLRLQLFFLASKTYVNLLLPLAELNQEIAYYVIPTEYFINILRLSPAAFH